MDEKYRIRSWELLDEKNLDQPINVIGAGAIGSFVTLALGKMGFSNITVWDDDEVSDENIGVQFYRVKDIGKPKVEALKEIVKDFCDTEISVKQKKYSEDEKTLQGIVICALDSMSARKMVWENHKEKMGPKLFVDSRMSAEACMCFAMNPLDSKDVESYGKTLYTDENAVQERCTGKATMHCVLGISCHVANVVKSFVGGQPYSRTMQWEMRSEDKKSWLKKG